MHVVKYGKEPNVYVRLEESYRTPDGPRKRVIKNFGRLDELTKDDPDAFEKLKEKYRQEEQNKKSAALMARAEQMKEVLSLDDSCVQGNGPTPCLRYGHYVLKRIWEGDLDLKTKINYIQKTDTRIKYDLNAAISMQVFSRILEPISILNSFGIKDSYVGDPLKDVAIHDMYRSLDLIFEHKRSIMKWINKKMDNKFGKFRAVQVFYDATNVYFETPLTDAERDRERSNFMEDVKKMAEIAFANGEISEECFDDEGNLVVENLPQNFLEAVADEKIQYLRMRGPSKEHRTDMPLASIVLIIDNNGMPMDFAVYSGNTSEFKTMQKTVKSFKDMYGIEEITISADRGINSVKNLKMLQELGFGFLVAQKVSNLGTKLTEQMLDESKYALINPGDPNSGKYQAIENYTKKTSATEKVNCTLVFTYNEKRKKRDEAILKAWRELVEKKIEKGEKIGPRKSGWASIAKVADDKEQPIIGIDEEVYQQKLKLCGYAAIVYSPSESEAKKGKGLTPAEIARAYGRQNEIEACFRILKSQLNLRPMFVSNDRHIEAHICICILALIVLRNIQNRLNKNNIFISTQKISKILSGATVLPLGFFLGTEKEEVMFVRADGTLRIRDGVERVPTEQLVEMIKNGELKMTGINELMEAVELPSLPKMCTRGELGRCLGTRFPKLTDAIPEAAAAMMSS